MSGKLLTAGERKELLNCLHCGFCLLPCPTYRVTGKETASPRGRLALMKAVDDGALPLSVNFAEQMYLCLACRACETACPAGVKYGELIEATRGELDRAGVRLARHNLLLRWLLQSVLPRPWRLNVLAKLLAVVQRLPGWRAALRLLPGGWRRRAELLPSLPWRAFSATGVLGPATGPRVGLLSGCIMRVAYPSVHEATVRLLQARGREVVVPPSHPCCGALQLHQGMEETARALARDTIRAFEETGVEAVVVNSAGCGSVMKAYGRLLAEDPVWAPRAAAFAAKVRDASEFLAELGVGNASSGAGAAHGSAASGPRSSAEGAAAPPVRVAYQEACHLAHAQRIREAPRRLLQELSGVELAELAHPDWCCGSAGVYNVTHPEMAETLVRQRMEEVRATGAEVLLVANPGCLVQLQAGAQRHAPAVRVWHLLEWLDRASRT